MKDSGITSVKLLNQRNFVGERPAPKRAPPLLGEHTREILKEPEYSESEIEELYKEGVVA